MAFLHALAEHTLALVRHHSLVAIFLLLVVEDCGVPLPLPGNVLLLYLGFRVSIGREALFPALFSLSAATWIGSILLYTIAFKVGRPVVMRYGRYVGLEVDRVARIEHWLARAGPLAVLVGRCLPGFRNPTSAISGTFGVPLLIFAAYSSIAALVWTSFWLLLGAYVGRRVPLDVTNISARHMLTGIAFLALLFLALPAVGFFNAWRERRRAAATRECPQGAQGCVEPTPAESRSDRPGVPAHRD